MVKKLLVFVVFVAACLILSGVSRTAAQETWSIYWYVCGSNLESDGKHATENIEELCTVALPENVKVIIQTGGAKKWHTKGIPSDSLGRYVYDSTGFHEVERLADANMGSGVTLRDFLIFAGEKYPAEHKALIIWNHGGGSLYGVCWDERYEGSIGLNDLRLALSGAMQENAANPPLDLVCFDTCLMASLETANALQGFARYMAASQEIMPEHGIDYSKSVGALAKNPAMDGAAFGKVICDTYFEHCAEKGTQNMATFSVLNLSELPALNEAYSQLGAQALQKAQADPKYFFTALDRVANNIERYGENGGSEEIGGGREMVDMGSLVESMEGVSAGGAVAEALNRAIVCKAEGKYRRYGKGLSVYYNLTDSTESLKAYSKLTGANDNFAKLYDKMTAGAGNGEQWFAFNTESLNGVPVALDENNMATVTLAPDVVNIVSNVDCSLYIPYENDFIWLGGDDKIFVDWEKGFFRDGLDEKWPALNGHILLMDLVEQHPDYNIYVSPIKLNGKEYQLWSSFDMERQAFEILGANRILQNGMVDRDIVQLRPGDVVTPIFMLNSNGNIVEGEPFTLESEAVLQDELMPDGNYAFVFRFKTAHNDAFISETINFSLQNGKMEMETMQKQAS